MKRKLTILTCLMVLCSFAFGQSHWGEIVYHGDFENNMSVNVKAKINDSEQTDSKIEVGVFCNGELRGYANIENVNNLNIYLALIQVHGKSGELFSFRLWNGQSEFYSDVIKEYNEEGYGSLSNPCVINFFTPVAEVDGTYYKTFAEALAAVKENSTLTLLDNVTIANPINVTANHTIDGNGKTLTYTGTDRAIDVRKDTNGATLTVKNLTVDCTASYCQRGINYNTSGTLSLDGVTVKGTNVSYALNLPGSSDNATVTINNSSLTGNIALNVWGENATINATGSDFTSVDKTDVENYTAVKLNNDGTTSAEGSVITITGGSITALDQNNQPSSATSNATATGKIIVSETTVVTGYTAEMIAAVKYTNTTDSYGCTTLEAAINTAKNNPNASVVLLKNATGKGVVIDGDVTIDFGGHTYSFNEGVGSGTITSNGLQILKGNTVTLKNGKLQVAEGSYNNFAMLIQNYADLTITDMTLDGNGLDKSANKSYVVSVNCGNVLINGNTTIIANKEGNTTPYALDSWDYSSAGYALPTVTINTIGKIDGSIEVTSTLKLEAVGEGSNIPYISIEGNGQLFHNGINTTIKKNIVGTTEGGWYTISSPVGTVNHENVSGLINGTHDLFRYNEIEMLWENVKVEANGFTTLEAGRGYLYANTANTELSFSGTLNTTAASQTLTITNNALSGFNLVGNPFTYNITKDNMSGATLAEGFYTLSNHGAWQANDENATIAPMQGTLIKATEITGDLTIAPASRTKRGESEDNGSIKINVSNENYNDVAYVSFNEGIGLDKIEHRNANVPMVYVPVDGVNYAIAMMSQDVTEIPVSFVAKIMGEYTIAAEAQNCEFAMMTLVDRFTGIETNLLTEDYTFIAKTNDKADRFFIRLDNSQQSTDNSHFAYINNGMINVDVEGHGVVNIYDVIGRPVAEFNVSESANISTSDFTSGMYIIRMSDENGIKVQKIVIE